MTGVEEGKGGGHDLSATDNAVQHQNGITEKAPVVTGTNMETLPRPGKQSDPSTAFLRAARAGQLEKVLEFLESGVDINASNSNGLNALHLAAKDGHLEIVRELLTRGATVDAATKKGNTALHIASLAGQEEVVQLLVQRGASVNAQSQNGFTPLYMAAQENHDSVVKFLLSKGSNQTLATEDGFTPLAVAMQQGHDKVVAVLLESDTRGKVRLPALHIAAKKDDCKAAALLLQNDHNPDVTSKSGFTPLHIAAHYGNDRIASLLYDKGADVNFAAKHNITPMHVAAKWGKIKMVNLLMSKGANIAAKTRDGLTPLHCAARAGHHEVVDILIEKGAPIGSKTKNGLAPLHMASQGDHVDAARILLYHRAPVDEVTVDYLTALHVAAHCGHVRVAKLLLDRNADPNARALNGFTPLHIACKKNRIKVVELLLKHKASIEATTESGLTPLHVASFMGCMNIVIYLLQNEASPDIPTVRGETPLHLAARANQTDIIRILLRNGAQVDARAREEQTPLHVASRLGNVDIVMLLLQHGADVDATTKDLYTPLHIAAKEGQEEVASVLLENGASLTATTKKGFTPLHLAAKYGNMNVARLLLLKNAPVDAQGKNGVTPLHVASHYDHQNVALLLLDKGASPHAMAKNGHTPLHIAARKNQMDIATTLLEYGAKANAESKAGFTPLHLSAQEGHTDMSTLLIEHKADTNHKAKNGLTPLHLCAQEDKTNVAAILVKNSAQVDAMTKAGYTPLHVAAHFGQAAMVRFLLRAGAAVDSSTGAGYTPLHQAAQQGHTLVINLLLESKAKPNAITNNGQTALAIAQKLGYISVVETLKVVTETVITTTQTITIEEKYKVQAPESMQETFMSDSEDEGGGDEIGMAAMNVYGQPPHAQHVYLPSYYQGQMTYTREDPMLSDQQQYRYMTVDDMKSMGDDSMRVNVTDDERDNRHSGGAIVMDTMTKDNYQRSNAANLKPDNVDIHRHPVHVGPSLESLNWSLAALGIVPKGQGMWRDRIPQWRNFLVSFLVDARGGAMRGCRHSGVRVIVPPRKAAMPMRVTCRYLKRDKLTNPPPLMEGEALASRILELGPVGAKFLGPVIIEVPHFASLRGKEREIVILRSDNGETWREHTLEASEEAVQDVLNESFEGEELSQLEDLQTSRIVRILTVDFPHYFAVVSRVRQEVHAVGPEGGTVSSSAVPQVQAVFPPAALTKKIRVGLQAHPIPAELVAKLLGNRVAVSPIVTVEPRRRKFHKPITLTIPVPQAANKGMINQYSGDAPTLRLLCSITGGQSRAVWEDVTGSTPLTFVKDCVSFTTTVSARFWLMDCRNITEATRMATELYTHATHVPFMAKFVVFAKRVDPLEARLRVFCMTDDKEDKTLEHQEHFTEVAKSRDVEVLEGKTQYMEFAGNLVPVMKSGEQLQLPFRAFKENRVPFTARVKDPDAADMVGRIMFMSEPKVAKGEPPQTPICTLNILLPEKISPETGHSELDLLELSKNYSFLRDGGISRPDTIHRATIRLTDIANLLDRDWEKLAEELNVLPVDVDKIKNEHPGKPALQAAAMFKLWQSNGNKATGNTLEKALNKIGREDIVKKCIFNVELVTDDVEKAVARVRLDQPGFDSLKEELGPSRDSSLRRDGSLADQKRGFDFDEPDRMRDFESVEELSKVGNVPHKRTKQQHITITNGTVFNGTSTPIKDKYASEEKDIGDDMAEFLEHKCLVTDTMTKRTRDDFDDDNKNRQRVIEDANRLVTGVIQDAEKEKEILAMEGLSGVYCDTGKEAEGAVGHRNNKSLIQNIENVMLREVSDRGEESVEPLIKKERIVIDDSRGGKVISKTIVTTSKGHPDSTSITTKTTTIKETLIPGQIHFFGTHDPVIGPETLQQQSAPSNDVGDIAMTKTIVRGDTIVGKKSISTGKLSIDEPEVQMVAFDTNVPTNRARVEAQGITRVAIDPELMSAHDKSASEKEKLSKDDKEVADKTSEFVETKSISKGKSGESMKNVGDSKLAKESKKSGEDSRKSAYDSVYNVPSEQTKEDGKKKSSIFSGIFKAPKLKKGKSKGSRETSFDSGDEEIRTTTRQFLDDTRKIANQSEHKMSPTYPEFDSTKLICICPAKLPEEEPQRDPIWATADFLYDSRRSAEAFIPGAQEPVIKAVNGQSEIIVTNVAKSENETSELPDTSTEPNEHKEKHGFFSNLFKGTKKAESDVDVTVQDVKNSVDAVHEKIMKDVDDVKGKSVNGVNNGMKSTKDAIDDTVRELNKTTEQVDTAIYKTQKTIDDTKKSICSEIKSIDDDSKRVSEEITSPEKNIKHTIKITDKFGKTHTEDDKQAALATKVDVEDSIDPVKEKSGGFFGIFKSPKSKDKRRSTSKEKNTSKDVSFDSGDEELRVATAAFLDDTKRASDKMFEADTSKSLSQAKTLELDTFMTSSTTHFDVPKDKLGGASYIITESSVKSDIPTTTITTKTLTTVKLIDDSKETIHSTAVPEVKPEAHVDNSVLKKLEKKEKRKSSDLEDSADEAKQRNNGFFGMFKSPKLKSKKKGRSRERSTSKELSFDSGDEELRQATSKFLEDTRMTAEIIGSTDTPRRKSLKDSVKTGETLRPKQAEDTPSNDMHSDVKTKEQDKGGIFGIFKSPKSNSRSRSKSKEKTSSTEMPIDIADEELRIATAKFLNDTKNISAIMDEYPYPSAPPLPNSKNEIKIDEKQKEKAKDDDRAGKASDKSGFLSGIFMGAKHAVEEVTEDVKEFWDETRDEAKLEETKAKHGAEKAAEDVKDLTNKASVNVEIIADEIARNISHSKDQAVDSGKAVEIKLRENTDNICADTNKVFNTFNDSVQKVLDGSKVKRTDDVEPFTASADTVKQKAETENIKIKDKVSTTISGILKGTKHAVDEVHDDVKEFWDETKEEAKLEKEKASRAAKEATETAAGTAQIIKDNVIESTDKSVRETINSTKKVGDEVKRAKDTAAKEIEKDAKLLKDKGIGTANVAADSAEEIKDKMEKEAKKVREKSKGFFSGIFKGVKHSTDETVDNVKKSVEDTEKAVEKEKDDAKLVAKDVKDYHTSDVLMEKDEVLQRLTECKDILRDEVTATKDAVIDTVKATEKKISIGATQKYEITEDVPKKSDHELIDDAKLMKEKATTAAEVITKEAEPVKDIAEKESKKAKEKGKGFFSGLFKGVKQASDEVVTDIKDFLDETKAESMEEEERVKHAAESAGESSKPSEDEIAIDFKKGMEKIAQDAEKVKNETREKIISGENVTIDTVKATHAPISDATTTTAQGVKKTAKEIGEDEKATKDAFDQTIKKNIKITSDKITDVVESMRDSAEKGETEIKQEAKGFKDKAHNTAKNVVNDVSNAVKAADETTRELTTDVADIERDIIREVKEDMKVVNEKVSAVPEIIVDALDTTKYKTEKEAKKVKEKSKGLFSGIFKGAKHTADKVTEDAKDFVDETKKEAQKDKEHANRVIKEAVDTVKNTKDTIDTDIITGANKIANNSEKAKAIVVEKLATDMDLITDAFKLTAKDSANINESVETAKDVLDTEIKKDTKRINDKLTGSAESIEDYTKAAENTAKQQMEGLKDKTHDTNTKIIEDVSKTGETVDKKSREVAKSIGGIQKHTVKDIKDDIMSAEQKLSDRTMAVIESTETLKHKIEKDGKKAKEKSKSFFSGIFKGSKHSIEETTDDGKDFLEEIKREASNEKGLAIKEAEDKLFAGKNEIVGNVKVTDEIIGEAKTGNIEKIRDIAKTIDNEAKKLEEAVDKDITTANKKVKEEIVKGTEIVGTSIGTTKDVTEKEVKKGKAKAGSFFSGIFKGAKQTIDGVTDDAKNMTNETNKEIEKTKSAVVGSITQDIKDVTDKAAANAEMATEKMSTKASEVMTDVADSTGRANDIVQGKLLDSKEVTEPTDAAILEISQETAEAVKKTTEKLGENIEEAKNIGDKELDRNVEMLKQKLASATDFVDDAVELGKKNLEQEERALKTATNNAVAEVGDAVRQADNVVDDKLREVAKGIEQSGKIAEVEVKEDLKIIKDKVSDSARTIADSTQGTKHKVEKEAKKVKEKGKGFFSGIFKGGKQSSDELTNDVKEFLDVTRREAAEEEDRARRAASETATAAKNLTDKAAANTTVEKDRIGVKITDDIEKLVDDVGKMKDKTLDKIVVVGQSAYDAVGTSDKTVTDTNEVIEQKIPDTTMKATAKRVHEEIVERKDADRDFIENVKVVREKFTGTANETVESAGEVQIKVEEGAKIAKVKGSGFFSGIAKDVKHVTDEVAGNVKDHMDDTQKEALVKERFKCAPEEAAQVIKDANDRVATDIKTDVAKIIDNTEKTKDKVEEKLVANKDAVTDTVKSTNAAIFESVIAVGEKIADAVTTTSKATKDIRTKVSEDINEARDAVDKRITTDKKRVKDELTDVPKNVADNDTAIETRAEQEFTILRDKIDRDAGKTAAALDDMGHKVIDVRAATKTIGRGINDDAKTVKDKISEETKTVTDYVGTAKKKSEKEAKKVKETGKGFFSGLFKGVKHVADESADDITNFLDETKKEAREKEERVRHVDETVVQAIDDAEGKVVVGIKTNMEKVTDAVDKVKDEAYEKMVDGKNAVTESAKSAFSSTSDAVMKSAQTADDHANRVDKDGKAARGGFNEGTKKDTKLIIDKLTGAAEFITDSTNESKAEIDQQAKIVKDTVQDAGDKIAEGASEAAEAVDNKACKINDGAEIMVDSAVSAKEKADKEAKKIKDTGKGFFSGLFKGVKHAADEVADDIKDFVEETKKEALQEEEQAKHAIEREIQATKDRKDNTVDCIEADVKTVADVAQKVQDRVNEKLIAGKDAVTDTATSTALFVSDAATKVAQTSNDAARRVTKGGEAIEHASQEGIKEEAKLFTDKFPSIAESISDSTKLAEGKIEQEVKTLKDKAQDAGEKIAVGASKATTAVDDSAREIVKDIHETKEAIMKKGKEEANAIKEKINDATEIVVDSAENMKNKADKEMKKTKEKGKGLFSGIFKSAKHAADKVTEDINDFVDETKKSAQTEEERAKRVPVEAAQAVKGIKDKVVTDVKADVEKIADGAERAKDKAQENVLIGTDALTDAVKSTGAAISDAASKTAGTANVTAKKVGEDVILVKDAFDKDITKNVKLVTDKVTGATESVTDSAKAIQAKLEQETKALKDNTQDVRKNVVKDVSKATNALDNKTHEIIEGLQDDTMAVKDKITDSARTVVESTATIKHKAEKDIKKGKGLFSGIFKGAKHTADKVAEDVKDVVKDGKTGVELEEEKAHHVINDAAKFLIDAKETASADIEKLESDIAYKMSEPIKNISEESKIVENEPKQTIGAIEGGVIDSTNIISKYQLEPADQATKKNKKVITKAAMNADKIKTQTVSEVKTETESMPHGTQAVTESAASSKQNAEKEVGKHKEMSSGFFSNIIQSAKHAVDEVSDEVKEFWDETKAEAREEDEHAHQVGKVDKKALDDVKNKTTKEVEKFFVATEKSPKLELKKNIVPSDDGVSEVVRKAHHKTEKETKKSNDKTSGTFFGILKGSKQASEEAIKDVKNFLDEAKCEASEEKTRIQKSAEELAKSVQDDVHSSKMKAIEDVSSIAKDIDHGENVDEKLVQKTEKVVNVTKDNQKMGVEKDKASIIKEPKNIVTTAIDSADVNKQKTKEAKKIKDKSSGFLSGIMKGAKHAVEEVSEDVKEFWDETKEQAKNEEEKMKRAAGETSKVVKNVEDKVIADTQTMGKSVSGKISQTINDVTDHTNATMNQATENLTIGNDSIVTAVKTTEQKIGVSAEKAVETSKDVAKEIGDDINKVKVGIRTEIEKNITAVEDKITGVAGVAVDSELTITDNDEKEVTKSKEKSTGMFFGIFKGPKHGSDEMPDESGEFLSGTGHDTKKEKDRALNAVTDLSTSIKDVTDKTASNIVGEKAMKDSIKKVEKIVDMDKQDNKNDVAEIETDEKKVKEKSGGFFSGIIKGAKHAVGEVSEEVKEFWDETKDEAREEEQNARRETEETTKSLGDNKSVTDLLEDEEVMRQQMTADLERAVHHNADSPTLYTEIPLKPRTSDIVLEHHVPEGDSKLERSPEKPKSSKGKSKGVISSLVKGAKTTSHKIIKEVDHATENIKDATGKFWKDTKQESTEYNSSGSYDVSSPLRVSDTLNINKSESDVKLKSFGPLDKLAKDKSLTDSESKMKSVSRIPQKISPTKELREVAKVDEVRVVRFEGGTSSTSIDGFDDSDVANKLGHLEPRARQSVTTVITKSVRTATASPPPSPDEFGDISIKDVTEEATKRAQSLANQAMATAKPGHDSAEIDGTVERHVTSAPTKQPVPAPRHPTKSSSSSSSSSSSPSLNKREFVLELDANHPARHHNQLNYKSPKSKIPEPARVSLKSRSSISSDSSSCVDESSQKSRIPVKTKERNQSEIVTKVVGTSELLPNADNFNDISDVISYSFPTDQTDQMTYTKTVTRIVSECVVPKQIEEFSEITKSSHELIDPSMDIDKHKNQVKTIGYTTKIIEDTGLEQMPLTKSQDDKQREINEENASGTVVRETVRSISTKSSWESSTRSRDDHDNWDQGQFSMDTSPGSGETGFAKNGDLPSDSDSEGSPRPTRRSLSKRRTIGSSSGSDVALHEGAELSPLEDDQESDFLQHSEPSYVETTTTEYDPETNERITRTTRTMTSSESMGDGTGESDDLRESMQKIVDQFMTEERRAQ